MPLQPPAAPHKTTATPLSPPPSLPEVDAGQGPHLAVERGGRDAGGWREERVEHRFQQGFMRVAEKRAHRVVGAAVMQQ